MASGALHRTARVTGHFGEFLQGRLGPDGPVVLVTLPCPALAAVAHYDPIGRFQAVVDPQGPLDRDQVHALLACLQDPPTGTASVQADMIAGGGAGASTAARVALIRAATGQKDPDRERDICLRLEGATDPLMHTDPASLLWASRTGEIVQHLPAPPVFDVLGGYLGAPERTDPADTRFADISDLIPRWTAACQAGDTAQTAALATESARRNAAHRGAEPLDTLLDIARSTGALGLASAHTGSARALLFDPGAGDVPVANKALAALGATNLIRFSTC